IRHAEVLYSVDSMASHVAAAVGTKCIAMYGGMHTIARWRPDGGNCVVWSNAVACSPCHHQNGCALMSCMRGFVPATIADSARDDLLSAPANKLMQCSISA